MAAITDGVVTQNAGTSAPADFSPLTGNDTTARIPDTKAPASTTPTDGSTPPSTSLQPGAQGQDVQKLQDYLVHTGYLTADQMGTGPGIYGPQTTAAVAKMQKDLGVQAGGNAGYYGPKTQAALSSKYQNLFGSLKNTEAPNSQGAASDQIQTAANAQNQQSTDPMYNAMSGSIDPIMQSLAQIAQNINNPSLTAISLQQEFADLQQRYNLPAMDAQRMNMQNIMNGTEDDIRAEVTKAGGGATESQIMGMTAARNKVIMKQYNALDTQYQSALNQVNNLMNYATTDQSTALQRQTATAGVLSNLASYESQRQQMGMTMQQHATDNLNKIVTNVGYQGLAAQAQGNPKILGYYENLLGLSPGSLSDQSALAGLETYRQQTIAQGQQKINISVGGGTGGGGSAGGAPSAATMAQVDYYTKTGNLPSFGYGTAGQIARSAFWNAVAGTGGDTVSNAATNKAQRAAMTTALRTQTTQYTANQTSIATLDKQLALAQSLSDQVDRTGSPLVNKYLLATKSGVFGDPDTAALNNIVKTAAYEFAKILSGSSASIAGATVSSAEDAKSLLNTAMSKGQFTTVLGYMKQEANYRLTSQKDTIDGINTDLKNIGKDTTQPQGSMSDSAYVESTLTSQGIKYADVIGGAKGNEIPAIDRSTGAVMYLQPNEFNSATYIQL
jgi:hypothetical protein